MNPKADPLVDLLADSAADSALDQPLDRQRQRTRKAIISAFNELVREGRIENIKVPDVINRANVGRSTFYEHFSNVTDVYLTAFSRPLSILADCLAGKDNRQHLEALLQHLWDNRHQARSAFSGRGRDQLCKLLRELVEDRIRNGQADTPALNSLELVQLCEGTMGLVRAWLINDIRCTVGSVADAIKAGVGLCRQRIG